MNRRLSLRPFALLLCSSLIGPTSFAQQIIKLSTPTSTENSGLLAYLLPKFEAKTNSQVNFIAVDSGMALETAKNGDVDVTLVHSRPSENSSIADCYGVNRRDVMYSDFTIVGPSADPAGIMGSTDVLAALKTIVDSKACVDQGAD